MHLYRDKEMLILVVGLLEPIVESTESVKQVS
jgi:hypothetical protein